MGIAKCTAPTPPGAPPEEKSAVPTQPSGFITWLRERYLESVWMVKYPKLEKGCSGHILLVI